MAAGLVAAAQAAGASLTIVLVPVIATWATAGFDDASWSQAVRFGVDGWLLAHRAGVAIPGGQVGLVPIGLLLVPLTCCWLAGVRIARTLDPHADTVRAGVGRAGAALPPARALATAVAGYAALTALACVLGTTGAVRPQPAPAILGAVAISAVGVLTGAATWAARGRRAGLRLVIGWLRLPRPVRQVLPVAALVVVAQFGVGLLLLAAALVAGHDRIGLLHSSLAPGLVGGVVLSLAQAVALPNLAVWAVAYAAGPGFAVGAGTTVRPGEVRLGALPAVPVLGALPDSPAPELAVWLLPTIGVVIGAVAGVRLATRAGAWPDLLTAVGTVAGLVGLAWCGLGWLAGGAAGPGRLAVTGPTPWLLAVVVAGQVGLGLLAGSGARRAWRPLTALIKECVTGRRSHIP